MTDRKPRRWSLYLTAAAIAAAWLASILGAVWAAAGDRAALGKDVQAATRSIRDHETRLRKLESLTAQIAGDVRWIRQAMEKSGE